MSKKVFILVHIFVLIAVIFCSCGEKPATEKNDLEMYPLNTVVNEIDEDSQGQRVQRRLARSSNVKTFEA